MTGLYDPKLTSVCVVFQTIQPGQFKIKNREGILKLKAPQIQYTPHKPIMDRVFLK